MHKINLILTTILLGALPLSAADVLVVDNIITSKTWTSNNTYIIRKPIFVEAPATLTIQPGTVIRGGEDFDADTVGSLIITRGAKIMAAGTRENPIIFTAEADDGTLTLADNQFWGGLIILGRAILNDANNPIINPGNPTINTREIEGIPSGNNLARYGGDNDDDNSGVLRYVSIRYGGYELSADNEINGLTLGAVGRGTTIEYVEVFNNSDDGMEFFGGTVNTKHMVMAFNEDEAFDYDQGYRGNNQFWFAIQKDTGIGSNYGGEHDGGDSPTKTFMPYATPTIYNATFIGSGVNADFAQTNSTFRLKDNTGGYYNNSIFTDFKDYAVQIDDSTTEAQFDAGNLAFYNNTWYGFGDYTGTLASLTLNGSSQELGVLDEARGNTIDANPELGGISRTANGGLDPRPLPGGPATTSPLSDYPDDDFFTPVSYRGAFGPGEDDNWLRGWTHLEEMGYLFNEPQSVGTVNVTMNITSDTLWTADNEYIIRKPIFVESPAVLTIEPGTVIRGGEDFDADTVGSLIITRGAKIMAEGTREAPIVFTAEADDGTLTLADNQFWGGLIILGNAILNDANNPIINPGNPTINTREIEGIPSGNNLAKYGGDDDDDSSGVLRFVSIRYGGYELSADNEINGLSLGAVGRGTTIEFVEVFNNSDDGVEFFGGTVNTKYMVMAFNEDEAFDYDQGFRGNNQFWFAIQKDTGIGSNYGGEHDGGDSPTKTFMPYATPTIYNATFIGSGVNADFAQTNSTFRLKDNTGGYYDNCIFTDFKDYAVQIDDSTTEAQFDAGNLAFHNNTWYGFGDYNGTLASLTLNGSSQELGVLDEARGNTVGVDPLLGGISRVANGGLDPRPVDGGPAFSSPLSDLPDDDFFTPAPYRGAFNSKEGNWLQGWTHLEEQGYLFTEVETPGTVNIVDNISEDTVWTADNEYVIRKPIFVLFPATLTIEPGTVIRGGEDFDADTVGSLIITRGAKIMAEGTREAPIIFTAEDDDGTLTLADNQYWGGLIILGKAILNDANNPVINPGNPTINEREIEGIPSGNNNAKYGGADDDDNSGVLRYVSIRYGGYELSADNEINGLSLGAVGRGTTIEFVEVFNNSDDGVEFFGGTVNTKYMVMAFNEDEAFDYDQGYRGNNQFWFAIQKDTGIGSNYGGEHDGGDSPTKTFMPYATPTIYNATFIGSGVGASFSQTNSTFRLKDNTGGYYNNSIFTDFKDYAVQIDDSTTEAQFDAGNLAFYNNTWYGFGDYTGTLASLTLNGSSQELGVLDAARGNTVDSDPLLRGISRIADGSLDPRPQAGSPALSGPVSDLPSDDHFTEAPYRGAFDGTTNWLRGWTQLDRLGYLSREMIMDLGGGDNTAPTVTGFSFNLDEDGTHAFAQVDFTSRFNDTDGDSLSKIRITSLPGDGSLLVGSSAVSLNGVVSVGSLGNLVYQPDPSYFGGDSFQWQGHDGTTYSTSATVTVTVNAIFDGASATTVEGVAAGDGGKVLINIATNFGEYYKVQYSTDLQNWNDVPNSAFTGDGTVLERMIMPVTTEDSEFYRVVVEEDAPNN